MKLVKGLGHFDKAVDIDQSPIGRTPRSNPATLHWLILTLFVIWFLAHKKPWREGIPQADLV